jgi:sarcosine oxidase subunit beta
MLPKTAEVVIIGGGVMGVSTAYHLALKGCRDVLLLEREAFFGEGATGRCAGGIRYQFSTDVNIQLSVHSIPMLERFEEEIGQPIDLKQCGYLIVASSEEDMETFRANVARQHKHGVMTQILSPDEIVERVPLLNLDGIVGATFFGRDGIADPSGVVAGYVSRARDLGATLLNQIEVTGITVRVGRVAGVQTPSGEVATERAVIAAGPWTGLVGKMAGVELPIVPERQQIVVTAPLDWLPDDFPFVIDFAQRLYFHPEGEGLLTGQSMVGRPPTFEQTVDPNWTAIHIANAVARLPMLEHAQVLTQWAGLYENTPDAHPIIGPIPQVKGLFCVAGFSGHGFMHGPIAGLLLAEDILEEGAHTIDIAPLRFARFQKGALMDEYNVI